MLRERSCHVANKELLSSSRFRGSTYASDLYKNPPPQQNAPNTSLPKTPMSASQPLVHGIRRQVRSCDTCLSQIPPVILQAVAELNVILAKATKSRKDDVQQSTRGSVPPHTFIDTYRLKCGPALKVSPTTTYGMTYNRSAHCR